MSAISEQTSVSRQFDTIMKNRHRRFRYLMRNDRIDDAMAIADEFFEWLNPEIELNEDVLGYYCEDELEDIYNEARQ
tara:strand:+ start:3368 stop:3598 length:231 start_codon:yes stop_codon:yes gene_type:complete